VTATGLLCSICGAQLGEPTIEAPDRLHGTGGTYRVARCRVCGAGVTQPRVSDEELGAFYPDEYGPYNEQLGGWQRIASRLIRAFQGWDAMRAAPLSALGERPVGRGLDVGCGRGDLAAMLIGHGWAMSGVEPSPAACEAAAARGVDARCGTLSTVALEPEVYDAVVFMHSLEHTNDPVADLRRVRSALAPGGLVLITVPNFGGWQARRLRSSWFHLDLPRHRVHFTPDALERALTGAGLEVVSISASSSPVGLPASFQYRVFGRCLFPGGMALRVATGLCALAFPLVLGLDALAGPRDGDLLHAVARRPG
jgi:SAM-dependent methyltransferase